MQDEATHMPTAHVSDRSIVAVEGPDAEHFLQNLVTTDLDTLGRNAARPGALLSPQGKILFDFLVMRDDGALLLDVATAQAADLARRLTLYKLRAKIEISLREQTLVAVSWQSDSTGAPNDAGVLDARFAHGDVVRHYRQCPAADTVPADWTAYRIAQGVPESGHDFALGDIFPHDALLDQMGGVGFRKGCYVGQEVVSRMHHRGTARRRFLIATGDAALPPAGTAVSADGRPIGTLGSVTGTKGLALVRLDRAKAALDAATPIQADAVRLDLAIPAWAAFDFPNDAATAED
jgi:folate-binding protein YgfZ